MLTNGDQLMYDMFIRPLHELKPHGGKATGLWVYTDLNFYQYTQYVHRLCSEGDSCALDIYNIYQPQDFLIDLVIKYRDKLASDFPQLRQPIERMLFSTSPDRPINHHRYYESRTVVRHLVDNGAFKDAGMAKQIDYLSRLAFPSLQSIDKFAAAHPDRFRRVTILKREYRDALTVEHIHGRLFQLPLVYITVNQ